MQVQARAVTADRFLLVAAGMAGFTGETGTVSQDRSYHAEKFDLTILDADFQYGA